MPDRVGQSVMTLEHVAVSLEHRQPNLWPTTPLLITAIMLSSGTAEAQRQAEQAAGRDMRSISLWLGDPVRALPVR